jgi:sugar phosphate isomerase/epimerase
LIAGKPPDIKMHLENIMDRNPELLSELVCRVDSPLLDIALDIGHAQAYSKVTPLYWIESLKTQVGYVHLHDNHGAEDEHLALGDGNIPVADTLDALDKYASGAVWSIESGGGKMYRSIAWLKRTAILSAQSYEFYV